FAPQCRAPPTRVSATRPRRLPSTRAHAPSARRMPRSCWLNSHACSAPRKGWPPPWYCKRSSADRSPSAHDAEVSVSCRTAESLRGRLEPPPPRPLPEAERGSKPWFSPPPRDGEGGGGRGC